MYSMYVWTQLCSSEGNEATQFRLLTVSLPTASFSPRRPSTCKMLMFFNETKQIVVTNCDFENPKYYMPFSCKCVFGSITFELSLQFAAVITNIFNVELFEV